MERAHSHRLIAIADPHRLRLVTCKANRRSQTAVRQGTIAVGAPVQLCTVTGVHKLDHGARRGQSRRQRSHQTEENEKSHSPELCKSAWRRPQGDGASSRFGMTPRASLLASSRVSRVGLRNVRGLQLDPISRTGQRARSEQRSNGAQETRLGRQVGMRLPQGVGADPGCSGLSLTVVRFPRSPHQFHTTGGRTGGCSHV